MGFQWRNSKGFGTISFSVVVAGITLGYYYYQHGTFLNEQKVSAKSVADTRIKVVEEKLSKMSGFLIASNLIACKQKAWVDGKAGGTCIWNTTTYAGDESVYKPSRFKLTELVRTLDEKEKLKSDIRHKLTFIVNIKELFQGDETLKFLTGANTWLQFSLVNQNSFTSNIGKTNNSTGANQDEYLVLVEGNIEYYDANHKTVAESFVTAVRRPLAIPKVTVTTSACAQRCDVSVVESPNPSCRSTFYIDKDTKTDITAKTINMGPGLIYDLQYKRTTAFNAGATYSKIPDNQEQSVNVGVEDFVIPGEVKRWADTFPCGTLTETITKTQQVVQSENNLIIDGLVSFNRNNTSFFEQLGQIIIPEAKAQYYETVDAGSSSVTTLSQHSNPAGAVVYEISPNKAGASSMEPYRLTTNSGISSGDQKFKGLMNTTVNTTFYKLIWVDPPH